MKAKDRSLPLRENEEGLVKRKLFKSNKRRLKKKKCRLIKNLRKNRIILKFLAVKS